MSYTQPGTRNDYKKIPKDVGRSKGKFMPTVNQIKASKSHPAQPMHTEDQINDPVGRAKWRVTNALPYWTRWPRKLRRLYALLDQFGSSDASIRDICNEFGWEYDGLMEMAETEPGFKAALEDFRTTGLFAKKDDWKKRITRDQIELVIVDEDALSQLLHVEDQRAKDKAGVDYALKRVLSRGYLENQRSINAEPQQVIDRQEKTSGVPISPGEADGIRNAGTVSGLDWDLPEAEEDY